MRLIPRQATLEELEEQDGRGFGFLFEKRILKWKTFELAYIASCLLSVNPYLIQPVYILRAIPND